LKRIVEEAMRITSEICIFTNNNVVIESLPPRKRKNEKTRKRPEEIGAVFLTETRIMTEPINSLSAMADTETRKVPGLTPRQIVQELDKYLSGRTTRKNRWPSHCVTVEAAHSRRRYAGRDLSQEHHHDRFDGSR
jgi:hypothetical protein